MVYPGSAYTDPARQPFRPEQLVITVDKSGSRQYAKSGQPTRYGRYTEIRTRDHEFHFNRNGQIKFIRGLDNQWPHPFDTMKHTDGNDWVYYTVGAVIEQRGIRNWLGEYYLPCFAYQSNTIVDFTPYSLPAVTNALAAWSMLYANICTMPMDRFPLRTREFLDRIAKNDDSALHARAENLHDIIGGHISVLPPDTRHVDYNVIPLNIADGCLYHCKFCCVKSDMRFRPRTLKNIREQIRDLKEFYGHDLPNYNALFLGNHDALAAGAELVCATASEAFIGLDMEQSFISQPRLFLFGSVDSFLKSDGTLMDSLNDLPFFTHINIGLESVDAATIKEIGKPLSVTDIREAFGKMVEVNQAYENIEISANFLLGEPLSQDHHMALAELLGSVSLARPNKGVVYLSPLVERRQNGNALLQSFFEIKKDSRLPVFIYLIQRL